MRLKYIATIHHLRSHYLPTWLHANTEHLHLHHNHHHHHHPHILYTLPSRVKPHVWAETKFSITEPDFQVYHAPCGRGAEHRVNRGVIVVCAMVHTPASVPRPSLPLPESTWTWRACGGAFHGTSVLSRAAFLDRWRMHGLDEVNACTTLIPKLGGVDDASGDWRFKLVTLREALGGGEAFEWIKGRPYGWEGGEGLVWKYENHDVWSYRHVGGAGRELDGTCTISCECVMCGCGVVC
jgi:hypothetical protein